MFGGTPEANNSLCALVSGSLEADRPAVIESSSVMGVQLLQSFISVVVMLLLLLSGDVETNPGPGECDTIIHYMCL